MSERERETESDRGYVCCLYCVRGGVHMRVREWTIIRIWKLAIASSLSPIHMAIILPWSIQPSDCGRSLWVNECVTHIEGMTKAELLYLKELYSLWGMPSWRSYSVFQDLAVCPPPLPKSSFENVFTQTKDSCRSLAKQRTQRQNLSPREKMAQTSSVLEMFESQSW